MRVFITGATGFVGRHIVRKLLEEGYEVHAGVRNLGKLESLFGDKVKGYEVDFASKEEVRKALTNSQPDYLIHLIGILFEERRKGITFYKAHALFSENLFSVAKELSVKKVVFMSALGTDDKAPSVYHQTKRWAEKYLMNSGLNYTVYRPSMILGPEQKLFSDMDKITKLIPVVALPGGGAYKFQPVDVRDVACAFVKSLKESSTDRRVFELCGSKVVSFKELLEDTFSLLGRRVLMLPLPKKLMFYMGKLVESVIEPPPFSSDQILMMWRDNVCSSQGIEEVCGKPPIPYEESIKWAVKGYLGK